MQPRSGRWSKRGLCGSGGAEAAVLVVGMALGASKLVSPYVLPEKAAPLHAEAVLQRLLRRLSQDQAGVTLGPSALLPLPLPSWPLHKVLVGTQCCLGPSVPVQGPGSCFRGELAL